MTGPWQAVSQGFTTRGGGRGIFGVFLATDDRPDPFDRMLIAQARIEGFTLVSVDSRFSDYEVDRLPLE